jgi:hypothetical protein
MKGRFLSFPWSSIPMEGMERLSLTEDDLIVDLVSPYMSAQLRHHEAAYKTRLTNPPQRVLRG